MMGTLRRKPGKHAHGTPVGRRDEDPGSEWADGKSVTGALRDLPAKPVFTPHDPQPEDFRTPAEVAAELTEKLSRPYAEPRTRALIFDSLNAPGLLPCTLCGAEFADADASAYSRWFGRMRRAAHQAGWGQDRYERWCCPDCLAPGTSIVQWSGEGADPLIGRAYADAVRKTAALFDAAEARTRMRFRQSLRNAFGNYWGARVGGDL